MSKIIEIAKSAPTTRSRWMFDDEFIKLAKADPRGTLHFAETADGRALLNAARLSPTTVEAAVAKSADAPIHTMFLYCLKLRHSANSWKRLTPTHQRGTSPRSLRRGTPDDHVYQFDHNGKFVK